MSSKRIERAQQTRAALVAAGRRLFCEHPVDAVAIDDIVQAAEVSKGSFYNHFPDRDALVREITAEIRADVERAVGRANAGVADPARRMARAVCVYLRYAVDDPERAGVLVRMHSGHTSISTPLALTFIEIPLRAATWWRSIFRPPAPARRRAGCGCRGAPARS